MISIVVISKDEPALDETLASVAPQARELGEETEIVVVDASEGRLGWIGERHPDVRWIDFQRPADVRISIPHQRNRGVREACGEIVVFVDSGCMARPGWLANLVAPIRSEGEQVVAGVAPAPNSEDGIYDAHIRAMAARRYVPEAPTINLAFVKAVHERLGGFDESFEYGSDIEFSWRLVDAGYRIRSAPGAAVEHEWGSGRRQLKRAYAYGKARVRLYRKHRHRVRRAWREDPMVFVYPAFLAGLPLTLRFRAYPALLLVPALRNRRNGSLRVVADHLAFGAGALVQLTDS